MDGPDGPGLEDPAGAWDDGVIPGDTIARMKRIPTIVAILRQFDRVSYLLSVGGDSASAVQALYVLASPYLKRVDGWSERWEDRQCAAIMDATGHPVPVPTPGDIATWFELIMDGLSEAKVIFQEVRLSYVGDKKQRRATNSDRPQLPMGPPSLAGTPMGTRPWTSTTGHMGPRLANGHDLYPGPIDATSLHPTRPKLTPSPHSLGARLMRLRPSPPPPSTSHASKQPPWDAPKPT